MRVHLAANATPTSPQTGTFIPYTEEDPQHDDKDYMSDSFDGSMKSSGETFVYLIVLNPYV
jgi:hypothetical protein